MRLGVEKVAMSTAASVAGIMGFSADRVEDLKTAVAEACINAIEHGNKLDDRLGVVPDTVRRTNLTKRIVTFDLLADAETLVSLG